MTSRRHLSEPPAVRPLGAGPGPRGGPGRATIAVVAAAGLAVGFLAAVSSSRSETASTTVPGDEPAALGAPEDTRAAATTPAPPTLGDVTPGFTGTLHFVTQLPGRRGTIHSWAHDEPQPRTSRLPEDVFLSSLAWNADRSLVAVLGRGLRDPVLYAGPPRQVVPVALRVTGFAWHGTDPGRMAWTEESADGITLVAASLGTTDVSAQVVGSIDGDVVAWGDWGYALQHFDGGPMLASVAPDLSVRGEAEVALARTVNTDIEVFFPPGTADHAIFDVTSAVVHDDLRLPVQSLAALLSPTRGELLSIAQEKAREAILHIRRPQFPTFAEAHEVPPSTILDHSASGRFVLLQSSVSRIDEDSVFRPLILLDRLNLNQHVVPAGLTQILSAAVEE